MTIIDEETNEKNSQLSMVTTKGSVIPTSPLDQKLCYPPFRHKTLDPKEIYSSYKFSSINQNQDSKPIL